MITVQATHEYTDEPITITLGTMNDARRDYAGSFAGSFFWRGPGAVLDWPIAYTSTEDADPIVRSNYRILLTELRARFAEGAPEDDENGIYIGGSFYLSNMGGMGALIERIHIRPEDAAIVAYVAGRLAYLSDYLYFDEDDLNAAEEEDAPKCAGCGSILYADNGDYDHDSDRCSLCAARYRIASATYGRASYRPAGSGKPYGRARLSLFALSSGRSHLYDWNHDLYLARVAYRRAVLVAS